MKEILSILFWIFIGGVIFRATDLYYFDKDIARILPLDRDPAWDVQDYEGDRECWEIKANRDIKWCRIDTTNPVEAK